VAALELDGRVPAVRTAGGDRIEASRIVLAAGAWAPLIRGLPRKLDVRPLRGQMIALPGTPLRHSVFGGHDYLVPRADGVTLAGATLEEVGFESAITASAGTHLAAAAAALSPRFAGVAPVRQWSGLRPATPDLLPILGPDPTAPALLYACGHSRNGILLAPYTARAIAGYVVGEALERDVGIFSISRFAGVG
jgi:glycine oxidase